MKIDRRITNGLAWAGVLLVVGIPAADLLSAQFSGDKAAPEQIAVVAPVAPTPVSSTQRPDAPKATAAVAPKPAATQSGNAVDSFVQSGKPLPSYITGGGAATPAPAQAAVTPKPAAVTAATTPVPSQTATTQPARTPIVTDPIQTAALPPKVAPMPMPLSMRPNPIRVPVATTTPPADIILPPGLGNVAPRPPAGMVDSADLDDWESGPLSEFLAQREGRGGSSATVTSDYDPNGFFLDEGPNPVGRDRVIGREVQPFPFFVN